MKSQSLIHRFAWLSVVISLGVGLMMASVTSAQSVVCPDSGLNVLATRQAGRTISIQFSVCNQNRVPFVALSKSAVRVLEDDRVVTTFDFQSIASDERTPVQDVPLVDGTVVPLDAIGASIGIVFDATRLINGSGSDARDHLSAGRAAIEAFLLQPGNPPPPRTAAPRNPERVGLFIPADQPGQSFRPNDLPDFTIDRYLVINTLRIGLPQRQGKTNLFAAVQTAVEATARDAKQHGGKAIVLVVSDGGDALTGEAFNSLVAQAAQQNVTVVTFGVGTDRALEKNGFRLQQLAEATGGRYYSRPTENDASDAFIRFVKPQPVALYTIAYETKVIDDGKEHRLAIEVATAEGSFSYSIPISLVNTSSGSLLSIWDVLLRQYFLFAIPLLVLLTGMVVAIMAKPRPSVGQARTEVKNSRS